MPRRCPVASRPATASAASATDQLRCASTSARTTTSPRSTRAHHRRTMSYLSISKSVNDDSFTARVTAAAAAEGANPPQNVVGQLLWPVATASDIAAAYESALAADNPDPGGDPSVITDQMILSAVQANWPTETP